MSAATRLTIPAGHPSLAGHFPGAPVLPGVLLLDEVLRTVDGDGETHGERWRIGRAKFLKPVRPGETLTLGHERLPDGSIRFSVSREGEPVARGVLLRESADRPDRRAPPERPLEPQALRADAARWAAQRERGSLPLLTVMTFVALRLGRPLARTLLYFIAAYFFAFAPSARRHAREYLRRALGREPTARDRFRQLFAFAATILDRFYLARERYGLFTITTEGEELMRELVASGKGAFLLGSHLGSFSMMSEFGRRRPGLRVALAMYEHTASRLAQLLGDADPASSPQIIPLGHLETMLRIRDCLDEGMFVGMLADRTLGAAPAHSVSFLGRPALFPTGPLRAAAALRRPAVFMAALYLGGDRYHVVFRLIADFSQPDAARRGAAVRTATERYAALLEEFCRREPYNWFNFYDFWHGAPAATTDEARGAVV